MKHHRSARLHANAVIFFPAQLIGILRITNLLQSHCLPYGLNEIIKRLPYLYYFLFRILSQIAKFYMAKIQN